MLEYLFNFIMNNLGIIFLCLLSFAIASFYSKRMKYIFFILIGGAALYFALLYLYRLGIGIEVLYEWSCKCVLMICNQIDYLTFFAFQHTLVFMKILKLILHHSLSNAIVLLISISFILAFILFTIEVVLPRFKSMSYKKIILNVKELNKNNHFNNTINRTESRYILNSVFRC